MALKLTFLIQIDVDGESVHITDKTGAFDATDNDTGWGTPNLELNQTAIAVLVQRSDADGLVNLLPIGADAKFSATAINTDETTFQLALLQDGRHLAYEFALPASNDAITTLAGDTLVDGDYFYWTTINAVYKIESSVPVAVTDYSEMVGVSSVVQTLCQDLILPDLTRKKHDLYREYKDPRSTRCNDDATFQEVLMLQQDIQGADYSFRSGLTTQSEEIIDTLLNEYQL
jgi:hypothetical protein